MKSRWIKVSICHKEDESVFDFITKTFGVSRNKIKKYHFSKKFLMSKSFYKRELKLPIDLVNHGIISSDYDGPKITILSSSREFLVLAKPAFCHCHPLQYSDTRNCLSYLRKKGHGNLKVNENSYDRGLLNRLDFETSGVLIYIQRDQLYKFCRENFSEVVIEKRYKCLVKGKCELKGSYQHYFSNMGHKGLKQKVSDRDDITDINGKQKKANKKSSTLGFLIIKEAIYNKKKDETLLTIQLKTGLRHQIRAQLAHLNFPIIGDTLYGGVLSNRLYLHAEFYQLKMGGKIYLFACPISDHI